jgi:hypothetical protein
VSTKVATKVSVLGSSAWLRHVNGERLRRFALFAMEPPI